jgi:ABC transporter, permease protein
MNKKVRLKKQNSIAAYLFVLPAVCLLLIFTLYPLINLLYLSFFNYNLIGSKQFVGLQNYYTLFFVKKDFCQALKNTAVFATTVVFFSLALAVLLAMWLQKDSLLNRLLQRSMFTPYLISTVSCAYIWSWMYDFDSGILNALLGIFKLPHLKWLNSSEMAIFCVATVAVWKSLGYYLIIALYSIKSIPRDVLDAARLENSNFIINFFYIILPMISPQIFFLLITITISSYKVFDIVKIMTNTGPGNATDVIVTYIYRYAFELNSKIGYASAAASILLLIMVILTYFYFKLLAKKVYYQ